MIQMTFFLLLLYVLCAQYVNLLAEASENPKLNLWRAGIHSEKS